MKVGSNVALLPSPELKEKDGDGGSTQYQQIIVDTALNGYTLSIHGGEDSTTQVFLYRGQGDDGPKGLINAIIQTLGLTDKVKLEK